jgi:hypothetical protein
MRLNVVAALRVMVLIPLMIVSFSSYRVPERVWCHRGTAPSRSSEQPSPWRIRGSNKTWREEFRSEQVSWFD